MASILNIIEEKQKPVSDSQPDTEDYNFLIFVSDTSFAKAPLVRASLGRFVVVTEYSDLFVNRSWEDLKARGINKIWICLKDKKAKAWLSMYILSIPAQKRDFKVVSVYSKRRGGAQKWIDDVKSDLVVQLEKLEKFQVLNFDDLMKSIVAHSIKIAAPLIHKWLACICRQGISGKD